LLQLEECVFDKMAELVKIFVVSSFLLPILLSRYHDNHSVLFCKLHDFVCIVSAISEEIFCRNTID